MVRVWKEKRRVRNIKDTEKEREERCLLMSNMKCSPAEEYGDFDVLVFDDVILHKRVRLLQ